MTPPVESFFPGVNTDRSRNPAEGFSGLKIMEKTENIVFFLVEPRGPGNIGSVGRALKNNGFSRLTLINPCDYKNDECYSMACKASDVVMGASVFPTLKEGLVGYNFVVGTTRRLGKERFPVLSLQEALPKILEMSGRNRVALLFGREDKGLRNDELKLCDILLELPSRRDYPSMNLSHAVFLLSHYLFIAEAGIARAMELAPREEAEKMYAHLERALRALEYGEKGGEHLLKTILRNFRKLFGRTGLMQKEINMLMGIFTQIIERCRP